MTTVPHHPAPDPAAGRLDLHARQLHAGALAHVSTPTLARLREARRAATAASSTTPARWRSPWLAGGAMAAALALAVVLRPEPATPPDAGTGATVAATGEEPAGTLQEDPVFYLWLASADAPALALE